MEPLEFVVERTNPHTLSIDGESASLLPDGAMLDDVKLYRGDRSIDLGPCRVESSSSLFKVGRQLITTDTVLDFSALEKRGLVTPLRQKFQQLPLIFGHKKQINAKFREYTADLVYDLEVYRGLFDEVDENIRRESPSTRSAIRKRVIETEGPAFYKWFDQNLDELEELVKDYTRQEHERHGFYFRKHMRSAIQASRFLNRTNTKPRGYAGDSVMMQWLYENEYRGQSIFSQLMHKHPLESAAAQAVRNRRYLIADFVQSHQDQYANEVFRIMSVACGPAWELRDIFTSKSSASNCRITLFDQDSHALAEARDGVQHLAEVYGIELDVAFVRGSVRTMLKTRELSSRLGHFDLIYSMGLFDYLTRPVAMAVLQNLYQLLDPGGRLVIGNFHVGNPTRIYMEYWMDWVLLYRTVEQFLGLTRKLNGAESAVSFEETQSQMFLEVRKP